MLKKLYTNKSNFSYVANYLYVPILAILGLVLTTYILVKFKEEYVAVFNITYLTMIISSVVILFGLSDAVIKLSKNNHEILNLAIYRLIKNSLIFLSIFSIFFLTNNFLDIITINFNYILGIYFSPLLAINKIFFSYLISNGKLIRFATMQITRVILLFSFTILFLQVADKNYCFGLSFLSCELILMIIFIYKNQIKIKKVYSKFDNLRDFSIKVYLNSVLLETQFKSEILILSIFLYQKESGIFSYMIFFFEGFYEISNVLKNILTSKYLDLINSKNKLKKAFITHGFFNLTLNLLLILIAIFILYVLYFYFNIPAFIVIIKSLLIVSIGYLLFTFFHPSENIFIVFGRPEYQSLYRLLSSIFNIFGAIIMINFFGLMGACINLSLSFVFASLLLLFFINRLKKDNGY